MGNESSSTHTLSHTSHDPALTRREIKDRQHSVIGKKKEYVFDPDLQYREHELISHMKKRYNIEVVPGGLLPNVKASERMIGVVDQTEKFLHIIPKDDTRRETRRQMADSMDIIRNKLLAPELMAINHKSNFKIDKVPGYADKRKELNSALSVLGDHDPKLLELLTFNTTVDEIVFILNSLFQIFWIMVNNQDVRAAAGGIAAFGLSAATGGINGNHAHMAAAGIFSFGADMDANRQAAFRRDVGAIASVIVDILFSVLRLVLQLAADILIRTPMALYLCCQHIIYLFVGGQQYFDAVNAVSIIGMRLDRTINFIRP